MQTNSARVNHVSGKKKSDILTKEDKYKWHYITLQYRLMSKLAIMGKVRHCIHICENISVIPTYGDICQQTPPQNHISDVDNMYNDEYKMMSAVEFNGCVVNPLDVCLSPRPSVRRPSLGII